MDAARFIVDNAILKCIEDRVDITFENVKARLGAPAGNNLIRWRIEAHNKNPEEIFKPRVPKYETLSDGSLSITDPDGASWIRLPSKEQEK